MKKSKLVTAVVASVLSAAAFGTMTVGCTDTGEPYVFEYEVSVIGGTGSGTYKDGSECSVTAEIPEGKKFDKWVNEYGEVLSIVNPYTFTVDGDTEIYAIVAGMETYRVEVVGGVITGTSDYDVTVYAGDEVSVTANSSNSHRFREWLINGTEKSTQNPYKFTATQGMSIEALFDESFLVAVSGGTIKDSEDTRKIYESGAECTLTAGEAPVDGQTFAYWYVLDEDGNEEIKSFENEYTFTVTGTDKYYAKFGLNYTVSVEGYGIFENPAYEGYKSVTVFEGDSITVKLDEENVPLNKGFLGWKIGEEIVSTDLSYRITNVTSDVTVTAELMDKTSYYATPDMSANQLFRKRMSGGNVNDYCLEFDRGASTAFSDANVYGITFYIYDNPFAAADEWVGQMRLDNEGGYRLATKDGVRLWTVEGSPANMWLDTAGDFHQGKGHRGNTMDMFKAAIESCGNTYSDNTVYYLAAQITAKRWSASGDSGISAIGPQYFSKNDVAQHTVTVTGGTVKGTNSLSSVTVFEGQNITLIPTMAKEDFKHWLVNGEIVEGDEERGAVTLTVTEDTEIYAVSANALSIEIVGGTLADGQTSGEFDSGEAVTVTANEPEEGKVFDYWYKVVNGEEVILSRDTEYEFTVAESVTITAKYANLCTVTVTGGTASELTANADGTYTVKENTTINIVPDLETIPESKGISGWNTGSETVSGLECSVTVTSDMTVSAVYADLVHEFATPNNNANQMFKFNDSYTIEFDRNGDKSHTEFAENVEYIVYYFYTSPYADKSEYVGRVKLLSYADGSADAAGNKYKTMFVTLDGTKIMGVKGSKGDLYQDETNGYPSKKDSMFAILEAGIASFDKDTAYYVAAQACGKDGSVYAPSDISVIGPQAFIYNTSVAQYTVSISGGKIKGTDLSSVTVYAGQKVTIVPDVSAEELKCWRVDGQVVNGDEETGAITVTVTANTQIFAVSSNTFTVSVVGGILADGSTSGDFESGETVRVTVDQMPAGKGLDYWYKVVDDEEVIVSREAIYEFPAAENVTLNAKLCNVYTVTVEGGLIDGLDKSANGTYVIKENTAITVNVEITAIPEGKGVTGWNKGGESVNGLTCTATVSADITISAVYADLVHEFAKPVNDSNQFFKVLDNGTIEIDRKNKGVQSEFDNANIEYIMFYFYNYPFVAPTAENSVGQIKFHRIINSGNESFRFETLDGRVLWTAKGRKSDLYHDNASEAGYADKSEMLFALVKGAVGDANFNPELPYYVAIQACGLDGSVYAPSEISAIGPQAFIKNNIARYTVSVSGGKIKGTELTSVTVYAGQKLTIVADDTENFEGWIINLDEENKIGAAEYEITVNGNISLIASGSNVKYTVTVNDTTASEAAPAQQLAAGTKITLTATNPEDGVKYAWFKTVGGNEVFVAAGTSFELTVTEDISLTFKEVTLLAAPSMAAGKEMLRAKDNYLLELDRGDATAFQPGVDYVKFYIYTSADADKDDYVGTFKLDKEGGIRLATMEGEKLLLIEGGNGNMWLDTLDGYGSDRKGNFFNMLRKVLGDSFDETATYHFAAQACSNAGYNDSEISEIGAQTFQFRAPEVTE